MTLIFNQFKWYTGVFVILKILKGGIEMRKLVLVVTVVLLAAQVVFASATLIQKYQVFQTKAVKVTVHDKRIKSNDPRRVTTFEINDRLAKPGKILEVCPFGQVTEQGYIWSSALPSHIPATGNDWHRGTQHVSWMLKNLADKKAKTLEIANGVLRVSKTGDKLTIEIVDFEKSTKVIDHMVVGQGEWLIWHNMWNEQRF